MFLKLRKCAYYLFFWIAFLYGAFEIVYKLAPKFTKDVPIIWAGPIAGFIALLYAALKINEILSENSKNEKTEVLDSLYKNAKIFLKKEFAIILFFSILIFGCIYFFVNSKSAACFITGAITFIISGYTGMKISIKSAIQSAFEKTLNNNFKTAYSSGLVTGFCTIGLAMIVLPILYNYFRDPSVINGFALGGCFIALFVNIFGSLFGKNADNPANENSSKDCTVNILSCNAENVSDTADLTGSYTGAIIASMVLGSICLDILGTVIPLTLAAIGIFSSILASSFVKIKKSKNPFTSAYIGLFAAFILFLLSSKYVIETVMIGEIKGIFHAVMSGSIAGLLLGIIAEYKSRRFSSAESKPAPIFLASLFKAGMISTFLPLFIISFNAIYAFIVIGGMHGYSMGVWGISLAAIGMLSTIGIIIASNTAVSLSNSSNNIAQILNLKDKEKSDKCTGNFLIALNNGIGTGSSALAAISLLIAYAMSVNLEDMDILNPFVISSLVFGACIPFVFCGFLTNSGSSSKNSKMRDDNPVKISANISAVKTILYILILFLVPVFIGLSIAHFFGKTIGAQTLGGLITGVIITGVCLSFMMKVFDNIKQEESSVCSEKYNPFKNISSCLSALIKIMPAIALVMAGLFIG
ncbi:MAG: sodium/proton-translocating pyrophosphatase [Candidatus Gastranaerophilales bacterium]|nr:sodium/proton-translocating pyrophosphatase [Candidatus Gastranaerophilales bacterium]